MPFYTISSGFSKLHDERLKIDRFSGDAFSNFVSTLKVSSFYDILVKRKDIVLKVRSWPDEGNL